MWRHVLDEGVREESGGGEVHESHLLDDLGGGASEEVWAEHDDDRGGRPRLAEPERRLAEGHREHGHGVERRVGAEERVGVIDEAREERQEEDDVEEVHEGHGERCSDGGDQAAELSSRAAAASSRGECQGPEFDRSCVNAPHGVPEQPHFHSPVTPVASR